MKVAAKAAINSRSTSRLYSYSCDMRLFYANRPLPHYLYSPEYSVSERMTGLREYLVRFFGFRLARLVVRIYERGGMLIVGQECSLTGTSGWRCNGRGFPDFLFFERGCWYRTRFLE